MVTIGVSENQNLASTTIGRPGHGTSEALPQNVAKRRPRGLGLFFDPTMYRFWDREVPIQRPNRKLLNREIPLEFLVHQAFIEFS